MRVSLPLLKDIIFQPACLFSKLAVFKESNAKNVQEAALSENCILVDELDHAIGQSTKRDCHRVDSNGRIKLHRAFSVFLFNSSGDMLIQKRSQHKVVYFYKLFVKSVQSILSILHNR